MGRYVDLEGNITITSDPKTPVFVSYATDHREAMREAFKAIVEDHHNPLATQTALAARFKAVVDDWVDDRGGVDPAQVMWAYLVGVWRYLQSIDDKEWDALTDVANDKVATLSLLCNPYDHILHNAPDKDPPVDH